MLRPRRVSPCLVALVAAACSSKAPSKAVTADPPAKVDAASLPAIAWRDDGTLAVDGRWKVDPETWRWTPIEGGAETAATTTPYPETPPAAAATAIREASGTWSAWAEATRICFIAMPVPGYVCAELPKAP